MTKSELISKIAMETKETKKLTTKIVDAVFETIGDAVVEGEAVNIVNFGKFQAKPLAARVCKNMQTGEQINVPASRRVAFVPSATLKSAVKGV